MSQLGSALLHSTVNMMTLGQKDANRIFVILTARTEQKELGNALMLRQGKRLLSNINATTIIVNLHTNARS